MEEQRYYINIWERLCLGLEPGCMTHKTLPEVQVEISEETFKFIEQFANVTIGNDLTKEYRINNIKFTITPKKT